MTGTGGCRGAEDRGEGGMDTAAPTNIHMPALPRRAVRRGRDGRASSLARGTPPAVKKKKRGEKGKKKKEKRGRVCVCDNATEGGGDCRI